MNKRRIMAYAVLLLILACSGCAQVISKDVRAQVDETLTVSRVQKDPEAYRGRMVLWSGTIIDSKNLKDGTELEVLQKPTGFGGRPTDVDYSEGRFLVINPGYLDTAVYSRGRDVTVAGEVQGKRTKSIGEIEYVYPVVAAKEIHLWPEEKEYAYPYYFPPYPYPYPYWRYQWRYDPFRSPWYPMWP
ncbi:MAG: Slp family lipoprotein [Pseudomonadota bacterium]